MDQETREMFQLILNKLDKQDSRMESMETRQGEMYSMLVALEENAKVTRASQDRMEYVLADILGKVNKLTTEVDEHENVIQQIKAIK